MGVSMLSIAEIIYFSSIRLICNFRTRRMDNGSQMVTVGTPISTVNGAIETAIEIEQY